MSTHDKPEMPRTKPQGYSLAILFLLIAVFSVLLALAATALRTSDMGDNRDTVALVAKFGAGGLGGAIFGAVLGLFHHRRWRGVMLGTAAGVMLGLLLIPVLAASEDATWALLSTSCFGAVVILVIATATRRGHSRGDWS